MLDYDTYINPWPSAVPSTLNGADGVDMATGASYSQPWGLVTYQIDGSFVPSGTKLWVIAANDKQVVGEVDMTGLGSYNFSGWGATYGVYGDDPGSSGVDEGASALEGLIVVAKIDGAYYQGCFATGSTLAGGYQWTKQKNNIVITSTEITPEPATLMLLAAGTLTVLVRRRCV